MSPIISHYYGPALHETESKVYRQEKVSQTKPYYYDIVLLLEPQLQCISSFVFYIWKVKIKHMSKLVNVITAWLCLRYFFWCYSLLSVWCKVKLPCPLRKLDLSQTPLSNGALGLIHGLINVRHCALFILVHGRCVRLVFYVSGSRNTWPVRKPVSQFGICSYSNLPS